MLGALSGSHLSLGLRMMEEGNEGKEKMRAR
jgi:hypothetical protein